MNLRDINYILAAKESGSFAKAAEICHVSQPSLSIQIKKVERELGGALFIRNKNGVRLTDLGQGLLSHFEAIQDHVSQIHSHADRRLGEKEEPVQLGAIATVAPYIFPYITDLDGFVFEESTTATLIKKLLDDEIDAALLALPIKVPSLRTTTIYKEPFYLVASDQNKKMDQMNLETMTPPTGSRFLVLSDEHCMGAQTVDLCRLHDHNASKIFKSTSLETIRLMVSTGKDVTLMPAMARRDHDGLQYSHLPDKFSRSIGLVYKDKNKHSDKIRDLVQTIKELDVVKGLAV